VRAVLRLPQRSNIVRRSFVRRSSPSNRHAPSTLHSVVGVFQHLSFVHSVSWRWIVDCFFARFLSDRLRRKNRRCPGSTFHGPLVESVRASGSLACLPELGWAPFFCSASCMARHSHFGRIFRISPSSFCSRELLFFSLFTLFWSYEKSNRCDSRRIPLASFFFFLLFEGQCVDSLRFS